MEKIRKMARKIIGVFSSGARLIKNGTVSVSQRACKWSATNKFWAIFIGVHILVVVFSVLYQLKVIQ